MKKIFKILYPFVFPVTLVIFLLYSFKVIKLEYHFGYQSANVYQTSFSWQKQVFFSELKRFKNKIFEFRQFLIDLDQIFYKRQDSDLLTIRDDMLESVNQFLYLYTLDN